MSGIWHPPPGRPVGMVNSDPVFGDRFSKALSFGSLRVGADAKWVMTVLALESGLDPAIENSAGARGLWQKLDPKHPLQTTDPGEQLEQAFDFWMSMKTVMKVPRFATRSGFYVLNLAPARLYGTDGSRTTTVLYANDVYDTAKAQALNITPAELLKCQSKSAYQANHWLDADHKGFIILSDLDKPLEAAYQRYRPRIERELAAMPAGPPPSI